MSATPTKLPVWLGRIGWLALLWTAGVGGLGAVAGLIRILMKLAGLSP
jgi:hypothetical protein